MIFSLDGDSRLQSMNCWCSDENKITDFLAYCCSIVLNCYGHDKVTEMFGYILFDYMMLRADGEPLGYYNAAGDAFRLWFEDGEYKFTAIIAN